MKKLIIICLTFLLASVADTFCQTQGQLLITGYDKTQPYYFCDGVGQTEGQNIIFAFVNINSNIPILVDSVQCLCDHSVFDVSGFDSMRNFTVGISASIVVGYIPKQEGNDTLKIIAYYGHFTSTGMIICHAISAPSIAFYGIETVKQNIGLGETLGVSDEILVGDTLHDRYTLPLAASDTAIDVRRYSFNYEIIIKSCGDNTIDNMYWVGDSSEIVIHGIPPLPWKMYTGSALVMPYSVTPKDVGRWPHYFVVHTTNNDYLVWSFEYSVYANNAVHGYVDSSPTLDAAIYPNPVHGAGTSVQLISSSDGVAHLHLVDITAKQSIELPDIRYTQGAGTYSLTLPHLSNGTYLLLIDSPQGRLVRTLAIEN